MKKLILAVITIFLVSSVAGPLAHINSKTSNDALNVAENWIYLITNTKGSWGGSEIATVEKIEEFTYGEQLLGYFCRVKPHGFIIISLHKDLAPVKAYSSVDDVDPNVDEGFIDLVKRKMSRILDGYEEYICSINSAQPGDSTVIFEYSYEKAWNILASNTDFFKEALKSGESVLDYEEGDILLPGNNWHQHPPYNNNCPDLGCSHNFNSRALVGCTVTAAAQIMYYWAWPPYGSGGYPVSDSYAWSNMLNNYSYDAANNWFTDKDGNPVTWAQINAVAELCRDIGIVHGEMDYGCSGTGGNSGKIPSVLEDYFRYYLIDTYYRTDYNDNSWFNLMVNDLNKNSPVYYHVENHNVVVDGWRKDYINHVLTPQIHMNYGWTSGEGASDNWYTLDNFPHHYGNERIFTSITPRNSMGTELLSLTYLNPQTFSEIPYRYFNRDASGGGSIFESGQYLQFLHNVTVTCTHNTLRFLGSNSDNTYMFTRGDVSKGIRIYNGGIELHPNGQLTIKSKL